MQFDIYSDDTEHKAGKAPICHITMKAQGPLGTVAFANAGNDVVMSGKVKNIVAAQNRTSGLCPTGTDEKVGEYTIQAAGITLKAKNNGAEVKFDVG